MTQTHGLVSHARRTLHFPSRPGMPPDDGSTRPPGALMRLPPHSLLEHARHAAQHVDPCCVTSLVVSKMHAQTTHGPTRPPHLASCYLTPSAPAADELTSQIGQRGADGEGQGQLKLLAGDAGSTAHPLRPAPPTLTSTVAGRRRRVAGSGSSLSRRNTTRRSHTFGRSSPTVSSPRSAIRRRTRSRSAPPSTRGHVGPRISATVPTR